MSAPSQNSTRRWRVGVVLLVASWPMGALGVVLVGIMATALRSPGWLVVGAGVYGFSWVVMGAGIWLAGWEGVRYAQEQWKRWVRRK